MIYKLPTLKEALKYFGHGGSISDNIRKEYDEVILNAAKKYAEICRLVDVGKLVLIPTFTTQKMNQAGWEALGWKDGSHAYEHVYKAMIQAAGKHELLQGDARESDKPNPIYYDEEGKCRKCGETTCIPEWNCVDAYSI